MLSLFREWWYRWKFRGAFRYLNTYRDAKVYVVTDRRAQALMRKTGTLAFAIAGKIVLRAKYMRGDVTIMRHEYQHVLQYRRDPFFYIRYLWHLWRVGYWDHPMEVEARHAELGNV